MSDRIRIFYIEYSMHIRVIFEILQPVLGYDIPHTPSYIEYNYYFLCK